jgi:hypothetical protein
MSIICDNCLSKDVTDCTHNNVGLINQITSKSGSSQTVIAPSQEASSLIEAVETQIHSGVSICPVTTFDLKVVRTVRNMYHQAGWKITDLFLPEYLSDYYLILD